jgi:hypothetical protein
MNTLSKLLVPVKGRVFIYGCGQFLYKVLPIIKSCYTIEIIIDDNPRFTGKQINDIHIVSFDTAKTYLRDSDTVLLTVMEVHKSTLIRKIESLHKDIHIIGIPLHSNFTFS